MKKMHECLEHFNLITKRRTRIERMKDEMTYSQELVCRPKSSRSVLSSLARRSCFENLGYQTRDHENKSSTKPSNKIR